MTEGAHFIKCIGCHGNFSVLCDLIIINAKLQRNLKWCVTFYLRHVGELFNQYYNHENRYQTTLYSIQQGVFRHAI